MMLKGLFLSWLTVIVSADTEILVYEPNGKLWVWTITTDSQGAGWIHPSTVKPRYKVCDVSDQIKREPNNWLRTNFIGVRNATRLDIEIHYNLLNCPKDDHTSKFCKTYLTLYSYHANTEQPVPDPTKRTFQKEAVITPKSLPPQGDSKTDIFHGSVVTRARGIYLAFLDQGVCITLTKVVISYRYCPKSVGALVTFPRTVAPVNDSHLSEQEGKCTDVNSVNKVKLVSVCLSNGEWNITDDLACLCKASYELVNRTMAALECKECPRGSYKSTISNTKCLLCPSNSTSNADRTACTCDDGFYDFETVLEGGCKVYSVSELYQQEKDKDKWNYAEVFVETEASTTILPRTDKEETKNAASIYLKIIYGFVGLLIVLVTSTVIYIVFKRRRHRKEPGSNQAPIKDGSEIRLHEDIPMLPLSEGQNHNDFLPNGFELDREQITLVRILGTGNFGQVSKATYGDSRLEVAVKSLKETAQQKDIQDMLTELEVMKLMQPHPHVVRLIGYCTEKDPLWVVLEYLPYGDLLGYLRKSRGHEDTYNTGEKRPNSKLREEDLLSFAWMIADGMSYLAAMKLVHRDLAARNVLVGENKVCKISDFGLARGLEGDIYTRKTQARLPVKWMPPESLFFGESTTMSDIWSYGIVIWEVFTIGESPYPGKTARQVANLLQTGYRMPRPRHLSKDLYSIMTECWEEQPRKRPTFQWLCNAIRRLLDDKKIYVSLDEYDDQEYVNFDMRIDE